MSEDHKENKEIDEISGVETTGHEWDGLKELNNPLPRWWVWIWLITIIWSVWYFIVYPAWPIPNGATKGTSGYTQYKELKENQSEILARQQTYLASFEKASFDEILNDQALYEFAMAGGKAAFKDNCATCHGTGAEGSQGYPNLNDDDWLWGGKIDEIHQTILYGARADNLDTHMSQMPAFGDEGLLKKEEIGDVVNFVLSLSKSDRDHHSMPGYEIFEKNCTSCHGTDAKGLKEFGAPNLTDAIWLYGGSYEDVYNTVYHAHRGQMPAWKTRLDPNTIKQLAVYVHQLGGGVTADETEAEPQAAHEEMENEQ